MSTLSYIKYSTNNRKALLVSTECACVFCLNRYDPKEITEWCDDVGKSNVTALCPRCGIDAVIPNSLVNYDMEMLNKWNTSGFKSLN